MAARSSSSAAVTSVNTPEHRGVSTQASDARPGESAIGMFRNIRILKHFSHNHAAKMNQRFVCTIATVCKSWNAAVLRADSGNLSIEPNLSREGDGDSIEAQWLDDNLSSLAVWLPKYGRLVGEIRLGKLNLTPCQFTNIASTLLKVSLQAAAWQGMQLRSFSTNVFHTSTILWALPCGSLTSLDLRDCDGAILAAVLPRLEHLQDLKLATVDVAACLRVLHQLRELTSLTLEFVDMLATQQLPTQLLHLDLNMSTKKELLSLAHLTRLTSLRIGLYLNGVQHGSALPQNLLHLNIATMLGGGPAIEVLQLTTLSRLELLELSGTHESASSLLELARLPRLQHLMLKSFVVREELLLGFMATSSAWPQIRQLQVLGLEGFSSQGLVIPQLPDVLCHVASCAGLTRLTVDLCVGNPGQVPVELCQYISNLHKLQELEVCCSEGATSWAGQAQHLRPLTSLTLLGLASKSCTQGHEVLSDAAIIASLLQLRQLQRLCVPVRSITLLPVIGSLCELRYLEVSGVTLEACTWTALSHLRDLKKLTELKGFEKCSQDVIARFWDAQAHD